MIPQTVQWAGDVVKMIDQTKLPHKLVMVEYHDWHEVAASITDMVVRGAPAIGGTAACGLALAGRQIAEAGGEFMPQFLHACEVFAATRPTAVNLFWAIERMKSVALKAPSASEASRLLRIESEQVLEEDIAINRKLGFYGQELLTDPCRVQTHCNAGALACVGYGTALGVFRAAREAGKQIKIYADETRPRLQGMQLTGWELIEDGFDVTIITDNMAASLQSRGEVDAVVVGADRIAMNGDTANKVGTFGLAVISNYHHVPFYIAAPLSTFDQNLADGSGIPIEERTHREVSHIQDVQIAPDGAKFWNPGFDVTPAALIAGIITEQGVLRPPYTQSIMQAIKGAKR
ncbi:MAG: S-methyl-5-thioribose-1-phosphate isomerase [Armatimonadota bacterium]